MYVGLLLGRGGGGLLVCCPLLPGWGFGPCLAPLFPFASGLFFEGFGFGFLLPPILSLGNVIPNILVGSTR